MEPVNEESIEDEMKPEVTIERARPEDAEEMVNLNAKSWMDTYPNEELGITAEMINRRVYGKNKEKIADRIGRYRHRIETQNDTDHAMFVARHNGKIIGISQPHLEQHKGQLRRRLGGLYVLKEHLRKGVGKQLIEQALRWHGNHDVYLTVTSYNKRAIKFYKDFGFEFTSELVVDEPADPDDVKLPELEMVRRATL